MSVKKAIVHEMTEEDLVKLATASGEVVMDKLTEAARFIYDVGVRHGDTRIPAQVIYHTYKHWKGYFNTKQPKAYFFRDFSKYFERHRNAEGVYYLLEPKPFDLSDENYWIIRAEIRRERRRRR